MLQLWVWHHINNPNAQLNDGITAVERNYGYLRGAIPVVVFILAALLAPVGGLLPRLLFLLIFVGTFLLRFYFRDKHQYVSRQESTTTSSRFDCMAKRKLTPDDMLARLAFYRSHEKFPDADWTHRELPLPDEAGREKMNRAVNAFIDFLTGLIERGDTEPEEFKENIQGYVDAWDVLHYNTDEIDFIIDVECTIMRVVGVDCTELAL